MNDSVDWLPERSPMLLDDMVAAGICYADLDPRLWLSTLKGIVSAGFNWVDVVVPWRTHALSAQEFDFANGLDLREFLMQVTSVGLRANLRVGPCASLSRPQFGLPEHVLGNTAMWARTHHGSPMWVPSAARLVAVPSYDSSPFMDAVALWFAAVAAQSSDIQAVGAVTLDTGDHWFFRDACLDGDFHDDCWQPFAAQSQVSKDALFATTTSARESSISNRMTWLLWKQARAERFASAITQRTIALWPQLHRFATITAAASIRQRRAVAAATRGGLILQSFLRTGDSEQPVLSFVDDHYVSIAEILAARSAWLPPVIAPTVMQRAVEGLLAGARGLVFSGWIPGEHEVAVERNAKSLAAELQHIKQSVRTSQVEMALIVQRDELTRCGARGGIDPVPPTLLRALGLDMSDFQPYQEQRQNQTYQQWLQVAHGALSQAGIRFDVLDDSATVADLQKYDAVIAPTSERINLSFAEVLKQLAAHKKTTVVLGPGLPRFDNDGVELAVGLLPVRVGKLREHSLFDMESLVSDLAALRQPT